MERRLPAGIMDRRRPRRLSTLWYNDGTFDEAVVSNPRAIPGFCLAVVVADFFAVVDGGTWSVLPEWKS